MFCPMCGKAINPGAKFCGKCGTTLVNLINMEDRASVNASNTIASQKTIASADSAKAELLGEDKTVLMQAPTELLSESEAFSQEIPAVSPQTETPNQRGVHLPSDGYGSPKRKSKAWIIIVCAALALIAAAALLLFSGGLSSLRIRPTVEAGSKYLLEMNYEQAIVEFNKVLELDPKNVDAYLGIAKAYHDMGDTSKAADILQEGYRETGNERIWKMLSEYSEGAENTAAATTAHTSTPTTTAAVQTTTSQTSAQNSEPEIVEEGLVYADISRYFDPDANLKVLGDGIIAYYKDEYSLPVVYSVDRDMNFRQIANNYIFNGIYGFNSTSGTFDNPEGDVDKFYVVKATSDGVEVIKESPYPMVVSQDGYIIYYSNRDGKSITVNMQSPAGNIISSIRVSADDYGSPTMIYGGFGIFLSRIRDSFNNSDYACYQMDNGTGNYIFGKDGSVEAVMYGDNRITDIFPTEKTSSDKKYVYQDYTYCYDKVILEYYDFDAALNMAFIDKVDSEYCLYSLGDLNSGKTSQLYRELKEAGSGLIRFVGKSGKAGYIDKNGKTLIKGCDDVGTSVGEYSFICENGKYYLVDNHLERIEEIDGVNVRSIGNDAFTCVKNGKLYLMTVN